MQLRQLQSTYPQTHKLIRRWVAAGHLNPRCVEGLSHYALARIEDGTTTEDDAFRLLRARGKNGP